MGLSFKNIQPKGKFKVFIKPQQTQSTYNSSSIWVWGEDSDNISQRTTPTQVGSDTDWEMVRCGDNFNFSRKTDGTLWAWGQNTYGQLGLGDTTNRTTPTQVGSDTDWEMVAGGGIHTIAIKAV